MSTLSRLTVTTEIILYSIKWPYNQINQYKLSYESNRRSRYSVMSLTKSGHNVRSG